MLQAPSQHSVASRDRPETDSAQAPHSRSQGAEGRPLVWTCGGRHLTSKSPTRPAPWDSRRPATTDPCGLLDVRSLGNANRRSTMRLVGAVLLVRLGDDLGDDGQGDLARAHGPRATRAGCSARSPRRTSSRRCAPRAARRWTAGRSTYPARSRRSVPTRFGCACIRKSRRTWTWTSWRANQSRHSA